MYAQGMKTRSKDFRTTVQYEGQTPLRGAYASLDTAIGHVRLAARCGAVEAQVVRVDGVLIADMVTGYERPISEWYS